MTKPTLAIYGIKDRNLFKYPAYVHDHNVCVMQNGKVLQYLQLERFSRRKYDNRLDLFLEQLIEQKVINCPEDFDLVCVNDFVGNAFISQNGRLRFEADRPRKLSFEISKANAYYQYDGWNGKEINAFLCQHETAHICSNLPFYGEFKDNSLLISIDGGSSLGNYSAFLYKDGKISHIENNWTDLGFASKLFNDNSLSFRMLNAKAGEHCSVPGKLMGFASWGNYDKKIEDWLVKHNYFKEYWKKEDSILNSINQEFGIVANFDTHDPFMQNIAATMQRIFENAILQKISQLQKRFHCDYLYYGGGCALNIVTNTKILESGMFKDVFIAPCCNDSGLSIGAAAFMEMQKGNKIQIHNPYLCNAGLDNADFEISDNEIAATAELLLKRKIVGVCNGAAEIGPRALGNRSLIALADSKELARKMSMEVKKREWYRPIAPIMLKENAEMVSFQKPNCLSKFMLMDFKIKPEFQRQMEGVVHSNQTARIQTIETESDNPFMYRLLKYLNEKHGVIALINTSFNAQGEPIVHTPQQAMESAKRMCIDGLVMNGKLLTLNK